MSDRILRNAHAGSTIIVLTENGLNSAPYGFEAGFARVGRGVCGADGTLNILDGARVEIREGATTNTGTTDSELQLGRDGATGTVVVDGAGSVISITQSSPDVGLFGPTLQIGRGDKNNGLLGDVDADEKLMHHIPAPVLRDLRHQPQSTVQDDERRSGQLPFRQTGCPAQEALGMPPASSE